MSVIDLEVRLLNYIRKDIFGKHWELDGESPEEAFLGKGTYGKVYAVVSDTVVGGKVTRQFGALKIIPVDETIFDTPNAQQLSDEDKQKRLRNERQKDEREIAIMEKVRGTTEIAYFLDSVVIERKDTRLKSWDVLILMDRHQGLQSYLKEHNLTPGTPGLLPMILRIWRDISRALVHCQNYSILHNDVKPGNLLYSPAKESFVLSDFGEALPLSIYPANKGYRGTLDYMSPEMYLKAGGDSRMDMYSLAMTIYELLNGRQVPFQDSVGRDQAWRTRILGKKPIQPIKGVPDDVNTVLLRCLDYDPEKRYATCRDMENAVLILYVKYTNKKANSNGKLKYVLIGAGVVGALAVGGVVYWLIGPTPPPPPGPTDTPTIGVDTPSPTPSPSPTPTATITPSPTPKDEPSPEPDLESSPVPVLRLGQMAPPIIERDGENVTIRGSFNAEGEIDPEQLVLLVDGEEWSVELTESQGEGQHSFVSQGTLSEDVQWANVQLALNVDDGERVTSGVSKVFVRTVETESVPTDAPEPDETPEPSLSLRLDEQELMVGTGEVVISGVVDVQGELTSDELRVWVNNNYISDVQWQPVEGGYRFDAFVTMDLEGMDSLSVRVTQSGNEAVEATDALPVVTPSPEPTHKLAALVLDSLDLLNGNLVSSGEDLVLSGYAEPGEALSCSVNGEVVSSNNVVDADGSFALELPTRLLADGENTVRLSYYGSGDASPAVEFTLVCDRQGPEINAVDYIDQFTTELYITASDAAQPCQVALMVNGETAMEADTDETGAVMFSGIDGLGLSADSNIELRATDALGNSSSWTIAFVRSLTSINVANRAQLEAMTIGQAGADVKISALPNAVLYISLNDEALTTLYVDADGGASYFLDSATLAQGENALRIGYSEVDGVQVAEEDAQAVELSLNCDGEAPEFEFAPSELVRGERVLTLTVSNEASYVAELYVDGELVDSGSFSDAEPHELEIPASVDLENARSIELVVTDEAGNETPSDVPTAFIAPIVVENAGALQGSVKGINDDVLLRLSGMPGAALALNCGNESRTLTLNGDGRLESYDLRPLLVEGANDIRIEYAESNGFLERALADTGAALTVNYDGEAPELTVETELSSDPSIITRDTTQIIVRVPNEPNGFGLALYVDGNQIWNWMTRNEDECTISGIDGIGLTESSEILLVAHDMANNTAEQSFRYSYSSVRKDADAGLRAAIEPTCIGEVAQVDAWVLSNSKDMVNAQLYMVDASGAQYACGYEAYVDDGSYAGLLAQENGELNANYADQAYSITSITVPGNCPSGTHELYLVIDTQFGEQLSLDLGTMEVLAHEALAGTSDGTFSVSAGEQVDLNNWVLCNSEVFMDPQRCQVRLVGEDGSVYGCNEVRKQLDASNYSLLMYAAEVELNTGYVDRAYSIASITVPEDCPSGVYTLVLAIETQNNSYSFDLGNIEVQMMEAYAASDGRDVMGSAGEKVDIDAWVLCKNENFNSMKRRLCLVDASGNSRECSSFDPEKLDAAGYASRLASVSGELDTSVADVGYAITSITIPQECPDGIYRLVLEMETEHHSGVNRYMWDLGGVVVSSSSSGATADELVYVNAAEGYAIGLDAPLQASFRPDDIVLTGWVYHTEDSVAHFDHCDLMDALERGTLYTTVFAGEGELLLRCDRGDIEEHSQGMTGGTVKNAGFVIRLNVSNATVESGKTYMLKLYTSNVHDVGWETLKIPIQIDNGAAEVSQQTIDSIVASWAPVEPTATPEVPEQP